MLVGGVGRCVGSLVFGGIDVVACVPGAAGVAGVVGSIGGGGSYADALSLLKNLPDIKKCCIKIVKGLQNIVKEKERKIKDYLKDINELNNLITIRKEIIRNSYK